MAFETAVPVCIRRGPEYGAARPTGARERCWRAVRSRRGFTLLEIAIVLFIMGLVLTMAMPHFSGIRSAHLKSEARRLAGRASYLYDRATASRMLLRLTFDLDRNAYYVSRLDPYAAAPIFRPDSEPGSAPVRMPVGVRLRDVTVDGVGTINRGTANCFFYPEGYVDATVVHLMDDSGAVFTLTFNPLSGRVAIQNGDLVPTPAIALAQ